MTISKGEGWGTPLQRPVDLAVAISDTQLAAHDPATGPVGLAGGDIFRSLGSPGPRLDSMLLPLDRLTVTLDDETVFAVAHVVARLPGRLGWWRGPLIAVCNSDFMNEWNVAPRAHPNDGRFDVVAVDSMRLRDRWAARQRLPHGTHVPHPSISVSTATERSWEFSEPLHIFVDGVSYGRRAHLHVAMEADILAIIV